MSNYYRTLIKLSHWTVLPKTPRLDPLVRCGISWHLVCTKQGILISYVKDNWCVPWAKHELPQKNSVAFLRKNAPPPFFPSQIIQGRQPGPVIFFNTRFFPFTNQPLRYKNQPERALHENSALPKMADIGEDSMQNAGVVFFLHFRFCQHYVPLWTVSLCMYSVPSMHLLSVSSYHKHCLSFDLSVDELVS